MQRTRITIITIIIYSYPSSYILVSRVGNRSPSWRRYNKKAKRPLAVAGVCVWLEGSSHDLDTWFMVRKFTRVSLVISGLVYPLKHFPTSGVRTLQVGCSRCARNPDFRNPRISRKKNRQLGLLNAIPA